ncbi:MAG: tRNA 2-thiouridine(34) synthase MnmA [Candidatus Gracilibacteria bacterium]
MIDKEIVVVGMSGGIDSSVTALLLTKAGYNCVGVQMQYWTEDICPINTIQKLEGAEDLSPENTRVPNRFKKIVENKCCSDESLLLSREICKFLNIPFYTYNVKAPFKEHIVDYYLEGFREGLTPNPCTECNKYIKFGELLDFAKKIGATKIATGHYSQIQFNNVTEEYELHEAVDKTKDQSYFLSALSQEQLSHVILPLGTYEKSKVRDIAEREGLTAYKKTYKESQGLCFFGEKTPHSFLERNLEKEYRVPGEIVTTDGKAVGKHEGTIYYTIGQRKGLNIGGLSEPYFVVKIDHLKNQVIVGPKSALYQKRLLLKNVHFISKKPADRLVQAKIRYRMTSSRGVLTPLLDGEHYLLEFFEGVFAITPGQVAVLQEGERILGQGIIEKCIDENEEIS